jgi:twitching motility protein PilT
MESVQPNTRFSEVLHWCEDHEASDLHVQVGHPLVVRINGNLSRLNEQQFPAFSDEALADLFQENFAPEVCEGIKSKREYDLSFYHGEQRYRANFSKQKGIQSCSFRIVPQQRQKLEDLNLPLSLAEITHEPRGLVLITGPTAQGKSTTARALLQHINGTAGLRIITIEDPIEYVFEDALSQFEQREVGIDTESFANGIRNAMRQDPNVLFVGEIRDPESIYAAMQAAETGHLVLTTLHADSTAQAIARIREFYPASEQENISSLLARNINSIVAQRLLPGANGARIPCLEILRRDKGIQEAIRTNNLQLLAGTVEAAVGQGMHSFDQYLIQLLAEGFISEETANQYAVNKHRLDMVRRGIVTSTAILRPDPVT